MTLLVGSLYTYQVLNILDKHINIPCSQATGLLFIFISPYTATRLVDGLQKKKIDVLRIAEVIFQTAIYGGMPATNQGLKTLKSVLEERGEWPLDE